MYRSKIEIYFDVLNVLEKERKITGITRAANLAHPLAVDTIDVLGRAGLIEVYDGSGPKEMYNYKPSNDVKYIRTERAKEYIEAYRRLNSLLKEKVDFSYGSK